MKIAILAAGDSSRNFPLLFDKPKCLYHYNGKVQLTRPIELAKQFCDEKDICVVAGYKSDKLIKYMSIEYPGIRVFVNDKYNDPVIYSYRTALQFGNDDYVFLCADESVKAENLKKVIDSKKKMALLSHDKYYYYSLGFFKLRADALSVIFDDCYLSMDYMKEVYCFVNNKQEYDGDFRIYDGVCMGYSTIDFVRRIGKIKVIENPQYSEENKYIDFIHYDPAVDYIPDLDRYDLTDEYKNSFWNRFYSRVISDNYKRIHRHLIRNSKYK